MPASRAKLPRHCSRLPSSSKEMSVSATLACSCGKQTARIGHRQCDIPPSSTSHGSWQQSIKSHPCCCLGARMASVYHWISSTPAGRHLINAGPQQHTHRISHLIVGTLQLTVSIQVYTDGLAGKIVRLQQLQGLQLRLMHAGVAGCVPSGYQHMQNSCTGEQYGWPAHGIEPTPISQHRVNFCTTA